MKKTEVNLINVKTGKEFKRFLTEKEFENLPFYICLPYEYESRKKEVLK
jgi:hypothetical protein